MHIRKANLVGGNQIDGEKGRIARRTGFGGIYKVAITQGYKDLTEEEVDLRTSYARSIIANYYSTPKETFHLRRQTRKQTLSSVDEVYYVKQLNKALGKISIRTQRTFSGVDMIFVYRVKTTRKLDKQDTNFRSRKSYLQTDAQKREHLRASDRSYHRGDKGQQSGDRER